MHYCPKAFVLILLFCACKTSSDPAKVQIRKVINSEKFWFIHTDVSGCMSPAAHLVCTREHDSLLFYFNDRLVRQTAFDDQVCRDISEMIENGWDNRSNISMNTPYLLYNETDTISFYCNRKIFRDNFNSLFLLDSRKTDSLKYTCFYFRH